MTGVLVNVYDATIKEHPARNVNAISSQLPLFRRGSAPLGQAPHPRHAPYRKHGKIVYGC